MNQEYSLTIVERVLAREEGFLDKNSENVIYKEKIVGKQYKDDDAEYLYLANLISDDLEVSPQRQAANVFRKIRHVLDQEKWSVRDIIRTWFFNRNIIEWYDDFNQEREVFFENNGIKDIYPASTCVGIKDELSVGMVANVLLVRPKNVNVLVQDAPSPLQGPAYEYKSLFSRGKKISTSQYHKLYISGTASIDQNGRTLYVGNIRKQIAHTMNVIKNMLEVHQMTFANISNGIFYFKELSHKNIVKGCLEAFNIKGELVCVDICRDDLLFEAEVSAIYYVGEGKGTGHSR